MVLYLMGALLLGALLMGALLLGALLMGAMGLMGVLLMGTLLLGALLMGVLLLARSMDQGGRRNPSIPCPAAAAIPDPHPDSAYHIDPAPMPEALHSSHIASLPLVHRGKVRDIYAVGDQELLIVTTDRISAFDVVLPDPIPGKGAILTALSRFWFARMADLLPHHLVERPLDQVLPDPAARAEVEGRALLVRRLKPLPIEAIVRGYLIGSGYKDYQRTGAVCGIPLPPGLRLAERLPEPLFTPSTKAELGQHDENISFAEVSERIGPDLAERVRAAAIAIYRRAAEYALGKGIIIADTKFEFGLDEAGGLVLIDEVLTPDSSRFWPADSYRPGENPASFDKQFVRDYLETLDWDKKAPGPRLPPEIIARTAEKYREAQGRLMG
jgi:phosphoribosylaminoimidazole-succinocarboxamide synthase